MIAIFKKDFSSQFHNFTGWLFLAVFWALMSLYVGMYCFIGLDPDISDILSVSATFFMILLPILCMRSFAEEQKSKTDQMILTAPISVGQVVIGKFLALAAVYSITVVGMCVYPVILSQYGEVPFSQSYLSLFGMWLFGLAEIAVCVFISSLTESVIIAAVISVAVLFVALVIPNLQSIISTDGNVVTMILGAFDIPSRFDTFLNGTLDLTSVVYLLSIIVVFLFFTTQVIQKRRYQVSKKTLSFGAYSGGMVAVMTVIAVVANLAVSALPSSVTSFDLTSNKLYSLTDETKEYLANLDEDVTIYVMASDSSMDSIVDTTLQNMAACTEHLTVTYVDPSANPSFLQEYSEVMNAYWNSLIVESGERYTIVDYSDMYEYSIDYTTYSTSVTGYDAEGLIDSAIAYVTSDVVPKVYVLTGHGESSLGSNFTEVLSKLNCESEELDLMVSDSVPEDCEVLIINGPTSDLSSEDAAIILAYLEGGGDLIAVTSFEASYDDMPNYASVLAFYGVSYSNGIVLENNQGYYYRYESYLLPDVASATETEDVTNGYVFVAYSQAVYEDADAATGGDVSYTELLTTSSNAYIHEGVDAYTSDFSMTSDDETGQFVLGLKAEVSVETQNAEDASEDSGEESSAEEDADTDTEADSDADTEDAGAEADAEEDADDADSEEAGADAEETTDEASEESEEDTDAEEEEASEEVTSTGYIFGSDMIFTDTADQLVSGSNASLFSGMINQSVDAEGVSDQISVAVKSVSSSYLTISTMTALFLCLVFIIIIPIALLVFGFVTWFLRRRR